MLRFVKLIHSPIKKVNKRYLSLYENHLQLGEKSDSALKFHYFWLRDHCRCSECYNHQSHQINNNVLTIPFDIKPTSCEENTDKLKITWADGHKTEYSVAFLKNLVENRRKPLREVVYWNRAKLSSLNDTKVSYKEYLENENGKKRLLKSILKYGFGFVTGVEPTMEATEKVVRHTTPIKKTIFGEMWEISTSTDYEDTAYTTVALGAHNDNTYFSEATGVMALHLLERDGNGGKTLLVDGFNAANNLRKVDQTAFDTLTNYPLESQFVGKEVHFTSVEPVLKLHPVTKELMQIRYNTYDRAFLNSLSFDDIMNFYKAYVSLGKQINKDSNQWWIQLEPGNVLFIDNWRVLHGRSEFTGTRKLAGCYVARRDWTSAAKRLGLPLY